MRLQGPMFLPSLPNVSLERMTPEHFFGSGSIVACLATSQLNRTKLLQICGSLSCSDAREHLVKLLRKAIPHPLLGES